MNPASFSQVLFFFLRNASSLNLTDDSLSHRVRGRPGSLKVETARDTINIKIPAVSELVNGPQRKISATEESVADERWIIS